MTTCSCPATALMHVRFADGIVLVRCSAHERQSWLVDGREAARADVLPALKGLFEERRGTRTAGSRTAPTRPAVIRIPPAYDASGSDDARLTALLHARGLTGSWAVA